MRAEVWWPVWRPEAGYCERCTKLAPWPHRHPPRYAADRIGRREAAQGALARICQPNMMRIHQIAERSNCRYAIAIFRTPPVCLHHSPPRLQDPGPGV